MFKLALVACVVATAAGAYCDAGNQQAEDSNLGAVTLAGIEEKTDCPGGTGVQFFENMKAELSPGGEYTLNFQVTTCANGYARKAAAWIDFNGNEKFEDWEKIGEQDVGNDKDPVPVNLPVKVPTAVAAGQSDLPNTVAKTGGRLRVMVVENGFDPMDPCLVFPYGAVKDFPVVFGGGGLDVGGILLIVVFAGGFLVIAGLTVFCWQVGFKGEKKGPKEFLSENVFGPIATFCGYAKAGVVFTGTKMKLPCFKGGTADGYEDL